MSESDMRRMSLEDIRRMKGQTDWERLRREGDYAGPAEFPVDWDKAILWEPEPKQMVSIRLDADLLEFFRAQGRGYQTRINAVLRAYKDATEKQS